MNRKTIITNNELFKAAELYNKRYQELGRNIKTVGWGSKADQKLRFEMLFRDLDPTGKRILDVGCGLGDLIPFLEEKTGGDYFYIGIDIADRLIEDARKTFKGDNKSFIVGDVFSLQEIDVDIAVLSGALSFKSEGIEDYAKDTISKMFSISKEVVALNFLTKYVDFELEKNMHYEPEKVFKWGKSLASKVNLFHDYPLYEFTLQMFKN